MSQQLIICNYVHKESNKHKEIGVQKQRFWRTSGKQTSKITEKRLRKAKLGHNYSKVWDTMKSMTGMSLTSNP